MNIAAIEIKDAVFICIALLTLVPCLVVVFSKNILYSAFGLFFTFLGTSGLYFFLDAEFLAITQVVVYIGGVSVLLLFAILLTKNVDEIRKTNTMSGPRLIAGGCAALLLGGGLLFAARGASWQIQQTDSYPQTTINALGNLLMTKYLLPFEIVSVLLLAVLVGSLVIARRSVK